VIISMLRSGLLEGKQLEFNLSQPRTDNI